jgi:hypothetical protein
MIFFSKVHNKGAIVARIEQRNFTLIGKNQRDNLNFLTELKYNHLTFTIGYQKHDLNKIRLTFNISPDMIEEVEELVKETARKYNLIME